LAKLFRQADFGSLMSTIAAFLQQKKPHSAVPSGRSRIAGSELGFRPERYRLSKAQKG
jgi:hypothetical protein